MEDKIPTNIVLTETAEIAINRTTHLYKTVSIIYFIYTIIFAWRIVLKFIIVGSTTKIPYFFFNNRVIPCTHLLQFLVSGVGLYFHFMGYKNQKLAFKLSNSTYFVNSYKFFNKGIICSLIVTVLAIILFAISTYLSL